MKSTMKALVCHKDGSIELMDRPMPCIRDPRDAVVKVTLSSICTSDLHIMHGAVPRANPETVLGHEFVSTTAGRVAGNWAAASTAVMQSMYASPLPIWA